MYRNCTETVPKLYRCTCTVPEFEGVIWRAKLKKAGIVDLHFHDTRHEACTRLAKRVSVLDLARIIGHRDLNSLMIYYNATAEEIAKRLG